MEIHKSGEDYLEAILILQKQKVKVRSVDLARYMNYSKPSICHAVKVLREGGFLTMDKDSFLHLTEIGQEVAKKIYERHRFFTEQLIAMGVDPDQAEQDEVSKTYSFSKSYVSYRKPRAVSTERRERARQMMIERSKV